MGANGGLACLTSGAGDRLEIRAGTYNESIDSNAQTIPSGTSYANAATIAAFAGEAVTIRQINIVSTNQYIIFERLVIDGALCSGCAQLIAVGGTAHHIRFLDIEGKNAPGNTVMLNQSAHHNEVIGGSFHDGAAYGFYVLGPDNLVERTRMYNLAGYAVHNYSAHPGQKPDRNIYRFNEIFAISGGRGGVFGVPTVVGNGLLLGVGDGNQAYGNIIRDNTGNGAEIGNGATNSKFYNNTVVGNNTSALSYGGLVYGIGSGTVIKNNIFYQNTGGDILDSHRVQTPTFGNNLCNNPGPGCAQSGNPHFVDLANKNYRLTAGSLARDRGTTLTEIPPYDMDKTTRPKGNGWDIGAYESW